MLFLWQLDSGNLVAAKQLLVALQWSLWSCQALISRVSCQKGPMCHASARRVGPFCQDNLDIMKIFGSHEWLVNIANGDHFLWGHQHQCIVVNFRKIFNFRFVFFPVERVIMPTRMMTSSLKTSRDFASRVTMARRALKLDQINLPLVGDSGTRAVSSLLVAEPGTGAAILPTDGTACFCKIKSPVSIWRTCLSDFHCCQIVVSYKWDNVMKD